MSDNDHVTGHGAEAERYQRLSWVAVDASGWVIAPGQASRQSAGRWLHRLMARVARGVFMKYKSLHLLTVDAIWLWVCMCVCVYGYGCVCTR